MSKTDTEWLDGPHVDVQTVGIYRWRGGAIEEASAQHINTLEAQANAARVLMAALMALRGVHAGSSAYKPAVALRMTDAALTVAREAGVEP